MTLPLTFAGARIEAEWGDKHVHPLLRGIFTEVVEYAFPRWAWIPHVTCIWRSQAEDAALQGSGIHCVWRAIDVRTKDVQPAAVADVVAWTNSRWVYDPARPSMVVCYAKPHGTGPHAHFQVCAMTALRSATGGAA